MDPSDNVNLLAEDQSMQKPKDTPTPVQLKKAVSILAQSNRKDLMALRSADAVDDRPFSFCPDDSPLVMAEVNRRAQIRRFRSLRWELGLSSL